MFEHLDDPTPYRPGRDLRRRVVARGRRIRWRRRLAATAGATTLALGTVSVGLVAYVERRDDAIDRADIAMAPSLDDAVNVLLIGTDARPGAEDGARADTIAILRVASDGSLAVLSLPRDLQVPGTGQRLAAAYADGGAQVLVDTLHGALGLPVDHVVEVDFAAFVGLVDDLGGLRLAVDVPLRDRTTGLDLAPTACTTLDGETALQLVRARHVDGDTLGDLGRMARTRAVLAAAMEQVGDAWDDPRELDRLSRMLADHAVLDDGLSLEVMAGLGRTLGRGDRSRIAAPELPLTDVRGADGAAFLGLGQGADAVLRDFGATDPLPAAVTATPAGATVLPGLTPLVGIHPC